MIKSKLTKHISFILISFVFAFGVCGFVQAQEAQEEVSLKSEIQKQSTALAGKSGAGYGKPGDARVVAARIIQFFLTFVAILFTVYTIYGGYLIMTSMGQEDRITKAKSIIKNGVLGIIITLMSYSISWYAINVIMYSQVPAFTSYWNWGLLPDDQGFYNTDPLEQSTVPFQYDWGSSEKEDFIWGNQ